MEKDQANGMQQSRLPVGGKSHLDVGGSDHNGRSFDSTNEKKESMHHGGSHHTYMSHKIDKLRQQFAVSASNAKTKSSLFAGIGILVDGLTNPSASELKLLMQEHGGRYENYYARPAVTHIIASNLTDAKIKIYQRERNPLPVVLPSWVVDSIASGTLLPAQDYILPRLRNLPGQSTIQGFLQSNSINKNKTKDVVAKPANELECQSNKRVSDVKAGFQLVNSYDQRQLVVAQHIAARLRSECDVLKGPPKSSKDDQNFVEHYYKASRLHFIGRWKARLEKLMSSRIATEGPMPKDSDKNQNKVQNSIMHIDMDCFFASVAEANHPEFRGLPLAVCHSNSSHGSGEVSSANYEARKYGIRASMFISNAKELCPDLVVVPYDFEKYEEVSEIVYKTLLKYTSRVQPVSCDEAFIDVSGLGNPESIAEALREEIKGKTGCTASAGIGCNMLLARLATKIAKPNGQYFFPSIESAEGYLLHLEVEELPGVGWRTSRKLLESGVQTVGDLRCIGKSKLQSLIGNSAGASLWEFAHGRDNRTVELPKARKSVGAEVNWGVRFTSDKDSEEFLVALATEVADRMNQSSVKGRTVTLKVKRASADWKEPVKYLGCGACDNISKSITVANAINSKQDLKQNALHLLHSLHIPYDEIRGIGLTVSKLNADTKQSKIQATKLFKSSSTDYLQSNPKALNNQNCSSLVAIQKTGNIYEDTRSVKDDKLNSNKDLDIGVEKEDDGGIVCEDSDIKPVEHIHSNPQKRKDPSRIESPDIQRLKRQAIGIQEEKSNHCSAINEMEHKNDLVSEIRGIMNESTTTNHNFDLALDKILQSHEGSSLSQIDAYELGKLPWQMQRELIAKLPRHRDGNSNIASSWTMKSESNLINSSIKCRAGLNAEPKGKISDHHCTVDDIPIKITGQDSYGEKSEITKPRPNADSIEIPTSSQIDSSVLEALPLSLRREIELQYGLKRSLRTKDSDCNGSEIRGNVKKFSGLRKGRAIRGRAVSKKQEKVSGLQRIDAFMSRTSSHELRKEEITTSGANHSSFHARNETTKGNQNLEEYSYSKIDPDILQELPSSIQHELRREFETQTSIKNGLRCDREESRYFSNIKDNSKEKKVVKELENSSDENDCWELGVAHNEDLPTSVYQLICLAEEDTSVNIEGIKLLSLIEEAVKDTETCFKIPITQDQNVDSEQNCNGAHSNDNRAPDRVEMHLLSGLEAAILRLSKGYVEKNLEQLKKLILTVRNLGDKFASFSKCSAQIIERLQRRACRRYGWPISLRTL